MRVFSIKNIMVGASLSIISQMAFAQVIVDGKNLNEDKELQYIQFLYYIDKTAAKPVYMIDFGITDDPKKPFTNQKLSIVGINVSSTMSPVSILNKLYKAGWEYMGDETYVQAPMMDNWYSYTLKRRSVTETSSY